MTRAAVLAIALAALMACLPQASGAGGLAVEVFAEDLDDPVHLTAPPGDPRLFVVEQRGVIRIIEGGELLERPFLDITDRVRSGGERGLLGLAFHPRYAETGHFYVNYTDDDGDTRVERYAVTDDPNVADPGSGTLVLAVAQPYGNHNGGQVLFGPDGMLYIPMGDGGSGGDPQGNGQNRATLLGALLRLDVDGGVPYAIPPDNPFVGDPDARGEIWAYGLRNPWRIAFDAEESLLYVADVGQNEWEEVTVVPANASGLNHGWNTMEGMDCFSPREGCDTAGLVLPAYQYPTDDGCAVIGGHVYRGGAIAELRGHYLFADYCEGFLRSFRFRLGRATEVTDWQIGDVGRVLSFGEDAAGELYILSSDGIVYRLARAP